MPHATALRKSAFCPSNIFVRFIRFSLKQ